MGERDRDREHETEGKREKEGEREKIKSEIEMERDRAHRMIHAVFVTERAWSVSSSSTRTPGLRCEHAQKPTMSISSSCTTNNREVSKLQ